jgi:hypothetical protein
MRGLAAYWKSEIIETTSVFINDDEPCLGLRSRDYDNWLKVGRTNHPQASHEPISPYFYNRSGEGNADAYLKRQSTSSFAFDHRNQHTQNPWRATPEYARLVGTGDHQVSSAARFCSLKAREEGVVRGHVRVSSLFRCAKCHLNA